jgi:uncharacterized iron-regulated membrane protein
LTNRAIRLWFLMHKWSSLVCTAFLLMLCITGLPLIFHEEIDYLTEEQPKFGMPGVGSSGNAEGLLALDEMMRRALANRPGEVPVFMAFDNDQPSMTVTTAPRPDSPGAEMTIQSFYRSTGEQIGMVAEDGGGVMHFLLQLHTDMFLGLPGMLFLGAMGGLFVVALVSGTVLYAPFMRRLDFGTLRVSRSPRVKWLDYHNLLGVVALAWMLVVGLTGDGIQSGVYPSDIKAVRISSLRADPSKIPSDRNLTAVRCLIETGRSLRRMSCNLGFR